LLTFLCPRVHDVDSLRVVGLPMWLVRWWRHADTVR